MDLNPASTTALSRPPAIVLASGLNGLSTVRSLGVCGIPVWAIVSDLNQPCVRSRFVRSVFRPSDEPIFSLLKRLRETHGLSAGVLIATSDDGAAELAAAAPSLPGGFRFAGPDWRIASLLMDKRSEIDMLETISDCLPPSLSTIPPTADAVQARLRLPIIVKPRTQQLADAVGMKNRVVTCAAALQAFMTEFEGALDCFVAQEIVPGNDDSIWQCNAVFDVGHELVSAFTFQKLGMSPPHFGVTTMGRSIRNDDIVSLVRSIGKALRYVGPAGFEFKRDSRDGCYRYIEINPRHGMTNWFDTRCGVNTAAFTYMVALGGEMSGQMPRQTVRTFIDLNADLVSRLLEDRESPVAVLFRYVTVLFSRRVAAYWWWRDPAPGIVALKRNLAGDFARVALAVRRRIFQLQSSPARR